MSSTTHPVAPEELMAYLDGELSVAETSSMAAHLESCPECNEIASNLKNASQSILRWHIDAPKPSLQEHVMEAAMFGQPSAAASIGWVRRIQLFFSRRLPWALACSALAILIVVRFFGVAGSSFGLRKRSAHEYQSVLLTNLPNSTLHRQADSSTAYSYAIESKAGGGGNADQYSFSSAASGKGGFSLAEANAIRGGRNDQSTILAAPMIARTISLSIITKDFDASRKSLDAILTRYNGYSANLSVSTPEGAARSIQASLRIPAPQLAATIVELKSLGRVENENQNGEEVTQQHADLVARLKNSRETEQRLQSILVQRTGKISDVLEVEQEIARVRGEIEQMQAEQQTLEHRVEFATIDLKLAEEYKAQLGAPAMSVSTQLRNALVNGLRTAADSVLSLVLFLSESGPVLLLWLAILALPTRQLWRRYRRAVAAV